MKKIISILMLSVLLFSCASTQERSEREMAKFLNVHTSYDMFRKLKFYSGHHVNRTADSTYQIDAVTRDKSATTYRINLFTQYYGDWIFYNTAFDTKGNELAILKKGREVDCYSSGCAYTEDIMLGVSRKYLKDNSSGIAIKLFNDKANSIVFYIPSAYIENFLSKTQSIVKID